MNTFLNGLRSIATASIAGSLLAAGSFFAVEALLPNEAQAGTTCRHNDFLGTTTCTGSGGTYTGRHNDFLGTTTWSGPGGSTTCRYNDFMNTTTCN